jgi:branched-chain amino acid transport system permease protein
MTSLLTILLDGAIYASWLFLAAVGVALTFGVMRILNVAHGSVYTFGAYGATVSLALWFRHDLPIGPAFLIPVVVAIIVGIVFGYVIERAVLATVGIADETAIVLATYSIFLILDDAIPFIWGDVSSPASPIYSALGSTHLLGTVFNNYELALIGLAFSVACVGSWLLHHTRKGKLLVVVINDREMAEALGINVKRSFLLTFILGSILGAMAGAFSAPMLSINQSIGAEIIVLSFAVVAIGGMGSIVGTLVGAAVVGLSRSCAVHFMPSIELFVIYAVMSCVLIMRPNGLFGALNARKI